MRRAIRVPEDTRKRQAAASNPGQSVWVPAHAGSGKTHVLAQRVIRLLLDGTDPARILCLTYTRAAAANMANRVTKNLAAWTLMPDADLAAAIADIEGVAPSPERLRRARRLFARALETPGGLKIQTIHAFCEAVLHQFTLEANIAGHFELLDPAMEEALVGEARRALILTAVEGGDRRLGEAFAHLLDVAGESGLETMLSAIVRSRAALASFITALGGEEDGFSPLYRAFDLDPGMDHSHILAEFWPDPFFTREFARAFGERADAAGKKRAGEFAERLGRACAASETEEAFEALTQAFLTGTGNARKPRDLKTVMAKGVGEHFPAMETEFGRFCAGLERALDRCAMLDMVRATASVLIIAEWLIARYERLKNARGFLDFSDLVTRTVNLLGRQDAAAWVHYKLDKGIDHILLDEAQDTSPEQWRVVKGLAEEFFAGKGQHEDRRRTVFAVGDEKQSIYSFQGAEPASFYYNGHEFRLRVEASGGRFVTSRLDRSFRSTLDVLSAVDLVFSDQAVRKGLTLDPEPIGHSTVREDDPGYVELWPSLGPDVVEEPDDWTTPIDHASAPAVRLAERIAAQVDMWLAGGDMLEGQGRRVGAGDVLVLVRKRDSFVHALSRALKNRGIPVAGADRLVLADHIAVKDLAAIGRFVLQPDDDLSLAALLKSPIFGFDDDDLMAFAPGRGENRSLFRAFREAAPGRPDFGTAVEQLDLWRNEAGYRTPFDFYSAVLARDGVRRSMMARLGHEAGDILDEFLAFCLAAERAGTISLDQFLALLEEGGPEIKRELDQARGEVRIMTAHAAKGLEAPVVFLVDSGGAPVHDGHLPTLMPFQPPGEAGAPWLVWRSSAWNNAFQRSLVEAAREKGEEEYRRLLYVGMTRAEDRLIVCGYHGVRGQNASSWHAIVEAALAGSDRTSERTDPLTNETVLRYRVNEPVAVVPAAEGEPRAPETALPAALLRPLPPVAALPRPLSPSGAAAIIDPQPATGLSSLSPVLSGESGPGFAARRGIATHRLLQVLPQIAEDERESRALRYLERYGSNWTQDERKAVWRSVRAILEDDEFAPIFSPGSRPEIEIMGTVDLGDEKRAVAGKIDRIAVTQDSVFVVDYKTSRPPPAHISDVPPAHIAQIALYLELLRPIYPGRKLAAGLLYTEAPVLHAIDEARRAAAIARLSGG